MITGLWLSLVFVLAVYTFFCRVLPAGVGRVKHVWIILHLALLLVISASFVLGFSVEWAWHFTRENGIVEWTTFWILLSAGLFFGMVVWRSLYLRLNIVAVISMLLCLGVAGEEIAWGQHLLHFEPPELFQIHNRQKELTLHNLVIGGIYIGSWLEAAGPTILFLMLLAWQRYFPDTARMRTGFDFQPSIASLFLIMGAFIFISAFPFSQELETAIPLAQLPRAIFQLHSSAESELSECVFAGFMLSGAIALMRNQTVYRHKPGHPKIINF